MKRIGQLAAISAAITLGAAAGYILATNEDLRNRLIRGAKDAYHETQKKVDVVSEEVALRTAKLTKNPKVNQDWVNSQWESLGY